MKIRRIHPTELFADAPELIKDSPWLKERLAKLPKEIFVSDDKVPGGHFTTYFGVIGLRDYYSNPYVKALYYIHELDHYEFLMRCRNLAREQKKRWTFLDWARVIEQSEAQASFTSECLVYLAIPEIRKYTFAHEIWMDKLLLRVRGLSYKEIEMRGFISPFRRERSEVYTKPLYDNWLERQIANYWANTGKWLTIWADGKGLWVDEAEVLKPAYRWVEEHMIDPDWMDSHQEWLDSHSFNGIPFWTQGRNFEAVYNESNRNFGNWLLET